MIPAELIVRKRDGGSLADDEWAAFFSGYLAGEIAEYQVAALLMAIYFQGMDEAETRALTRVMIESGERWTWDGLDGPVGDKHSTGGVGDKVSLILAPLSAACGIRVPMVSGRGLGHTAGTLDKLETIPGLRTGLEKADYDRLVREVGFAMGGQTENFAPLDRETYALRDVTGTIESIPLITASIMSKKLAEGLDGLILDVKWGDGAFIQDREHAEELARLMIAVGESFGVRTEALLTAMEIPLGRTVGHTLELREAIEVMQGADPDQRLLDVTIGLTERLLVLTGAAPDEAGARSMATQALESGKALERFTAFVEAQGGDPRVIEDPDRLPVAPSRLELKAPREAFLAELPARRVGRLLVEMGGGRRVKGEEIDDEVGLVFPHPIGVRLAAGETWAVVHARSDAGAERAGGVLESIVTWSEEAVETAPVVTARLSTGD
ncbi:MAG: thymidine phosphorylase [Gemmatimonadota bacterium]